VAAALALGWMALQLFVHPAPEPQRHAYTSVVYVLVACSLVHVAILVIMAAWLLARSAAGYVTQVRILEPRVVAVFWHYSVAQWVVGFSVIYLLPHL
jgi:cytochrome c oxidase subunit I+III